MKQLTVLLLAAGLALSDRAMEAAEDSRAAALLAQARAAIGGEQHLARVQGLSFAGTLQRMTGDREIAGDLTIDLQLPDKMLRRDTVRPFGDLVIVTEQGINGDTVLRNSRTLNAGPGAFIRTPPPVAPGSDAEAEARRGARAEMARVTIAMLLMAPASTPVDFSYAGEAEAPDGKADVLDVKGPGLAAKLFLDKSSHRPLMLMYRGVAAQMVLQRGAGPAAGRDSLPPPTPQMVDISLFFDDYRATDGVLFPHRLTQAVDGKTSEEWTFKTVAVNPTFKPNTFSVQ